MLKKEIPKPECAICARPAMYELLGVNTALHNDWHTLVDTIWEEAHSADCLSAWQVAMKLATDAPLEVQMNIGRRTSDSSSCACPDSEASLY